MFLETNFYGMSKLVKIGEHFYPDNDQQRRAWESYLEIELCKLVSEHKLPVCHHMLKWIVDILVE